MAVKSMPEVPAIHPAEATDAALLDACDVWRGRRGGPGGQHRNKVETAVGLLHRSTNIKVEANERRSQMENQRVAVTRLRAKLALEVRVTRPLDSVPSDRWRARLHGQQLVVHPKHRDFAPLLAEGLDVVTACQYDVRQAAEQLSTTTSQLLRLLRHEPVALAWLNQQRQQLGLRRLK